MANQFIYNLTDSWADAGTLFTAIKMNVTDTASDASSLLMDLQVGGTSKFRVNKDGGLYLTGNISSSPNTITIEAESFSSRFGAFSLSSNGIGAAQYSAIYFTNANGNASWQFRDTFITRAAAASFQLGNFDAASPVAQTLQVQSVVAGTTNTAGANFTIKGSAGTGTGAGGSIIFQVAPAGSSGSAQNAFITPFQIFPTGVGIGIQSGSFYNISVPTDGSAIGFRLGSTNMYFLETGTFRTSADNTRDLGTSGVRWSNIYGVNLWAGGNALLTSDAANILALRNGTTSQQFNVYNTYTSDSIKEFAAILWSGNELYIGASHAGSIRRNLRLFGENVDILTSSLGTSGNVLARWRFTSAGHFVPITSTGGGDNTYDIGESGGNRIRSGYFGTSIRTPQINNNGSTIGVEGVTSAFPALKRSGATLQVRLADDSGDAALQVGTATSGGTALNVTGTGGSSIASITNTTTGTLLQVLNSESNPLMTVNDTTTGTIFSVQSNTAATLFQVNDTSTGTLLAVSSNTGADVFTVDDNGAITANGTTVTSNTTPILNLSQTWNNSGQIFTGMRLNVTNTASAAGSSLLDLQIGGSSYFSVFQSSNRTWLRSGAGSSNNMGIGNYTTYGSAPFIDLNQNGSITVTVNANGFAVSGGPLMVGGSDVSLNRDDANTLALRNGANAQTFRVYNSYTDASNGEWLEATFSGNVAYLQTNKNGTGTIRNLVIGNYTGITSVIGQNVSSGLTIANSVTLNATQTLTLGAWYATPMLTLSQTSISVANHLLFGTDNTYDIGTSTTSRPRNVYIAGSLVAATKSFDIPHPTKQDMRLRYGSLEGPENGVYVRGKIEGKVIDLPDYWTGLVDEDSITVQLTAIGRSQSPYVVEVTDNKVFIDTENHTDAHCYYFIQAERKDVDKLVVEY